MVTIEEPLQAVKGQLGYAIESSKYNKEDPIGSGDDTHFGLVRDEVELPNPNDHEPMGTGGFGRRPYVLSPNQKEYSFDIPFLINDTNPPLEIAAGARSEETVDPDDTPDSGDEYKKITITEADILPTATIFQYQADAGDYGVINWYIGVKANLSIDVSQGDSLEFTLECMARSMDLDELTDSDPTPSLTTPEKDPFKFIHKGDIKLYEPGTTTEVNTLATVNGISGTLFDNGIEGNYHGNGREPYTLSQGNPEGKYDISLDITIQNLDMFKRAYNNSDPVDIEIPFRKDVTITTDNRDAVFIRLKKAKIIDAPLPKGDEGSIEAEIGVQPKEIEIELREPA